MNCLCKLEEGIESSRIGITDGCEPSCRCWELNPGLLEDQSVLLTTGPSLQPHFILFFKTLMYACARTHVRSHMLHSACSGQRITFKSEFMLSIFFKAETLLVISAATLYNLGYLIHVHPANYPFSSPASGRGRCWDYRKTPVSGFLHAFWGLTSGFQAWRQTPSPAQPSRLPSD